MSSSHKVTEPMPRLGDGYGYLVPSASPVLGRNVIRGNLSVCTGVQFLHVVAFQKFPKEDQRSTRSNTEKLKDRKFKTQRKDPFVSVDIRCGSPGVTEVQPGTYNGRAKKH